ncbi:MAG: hypothetical protein D4R73_05160 [Deltaproteobacteria bacterium]|nr:MAG: hypothetical protein D4R73_05160 [Deltaproteobacteria bacterium]
MTPERKTKIIKNEKGIVLITALLFLMVLTVLGTTAVMISSTDIKIGGNYKTSKQAFYNAEAGIERATDALKTADIDAVLANGGILGFGSSVSFGNGTYSVSVADNNDGDGNLLHDTDGKVVVTSTGTSANGSTTKIEVVFQKTTPTTSGLRAAVTSNGPIATLGNCAIDGRDHDINGIYTGSGTLGICSRSTYAGGGSSAVGGTVSGTNYAPPKKGLGDPGVVSQNSTSWTEPTTPEAVLGLTADYLKNIAISGTGGSRYVTDPASLTFPLSGVTYVELPSGQTWQPNDLGSSSGILIVHNTSRNAVLKNTNHGTFKGILITDDYVHCHNDIIGAVVCLTSAPSAGNNGNGNISYSSVAIASALSSVASWTRVSWREVR